MSDELREEYRFDYDQAKPNRFAAKLRHTVFQGIETEMRALDIIAVGIDYEFTWFDHGEHKVVNYPHYIEYRVQGVEDPARVGFGHETRYGCERRRVIVWVDGHATGFLGADDFKVTGEMVHGLYLPGQRAICRYTEPKPEDYSGLTLIEYKSSIRAPKVPHAWAVVANIADHATMIRAAIARRGTLPQIQESPSEHQLEVQPI